MNIIWRNEQFECDKAVKGVNYIHMYDKKYRSLYEIKNITADEWKHISIQNGEWSDPSEIPSELEILRADVDYLLMLSDE